MTFLGLLLVGKSSWENREVGKIGMLGSFILESPTWKYLYLIVSNFVENCPSQTKTFQRKIFTFLDSSNKTLPNRQCRSILLKFIQNEK